MNIKKNVTNWIAALSAALLLGCAPLVFAGGSYATKAYPIEETFESGIFPPTDWNVYDIVGSGTVWFASSFLNHTPAGTTSAYHGYAPGMLDGWMVTPALDMPVTGPIVLAFWNWTVDPSFYWKNSVLISTGSSDPASGDFVEIWTTATAAAEWQQVVINLEDYAGQTAYIAFRYEGDYAHGWAVDDVYIGSDFNTSPQISINPAIVNATAPANNSVTKTLTVSNAGVENLVYTMEISYGGGADGWLTSSPMSGDIGAGSNLAHTLTFDPDGLEIGDYSAWIAISSNDPETPEIEVPINFTIIEASNVVVNIMIPELTFPYDISESGEYVAISGFGSGGGWLWSQTSGLTSVGGIESLVQAVSEDGVIGGTARNPDYNISGQLVYMAGYWHPQTEEWTFLPINPAAGEPIYSDYNSTWGMTADGSTIVGMQYFSGYEYQAFKWTQSGGYEMIGDVNPAGNRPNGISNDGSVVYGWANLPAASRSPVIWHEDDFILIAPDLFGEASGASSTGEYVVGYADVNGFIWNALSGTTFFPNTLNDENINPLAVADDGTIFGYTVGWPPFPDARTAFVRLFSGEMMTFSDYALSRGMVGASDWTFYSINAVTPDGNKVIGSGISPEGDLVSFMINFEAEIANILVLPESLTETLYPGETSEQELMIQNTGNGSLNYETFINFTQSEKKSGNIAPVPSGRKTRKSGMGLSSISSKGGSPIHAKEINDFILNYDGENVDAIGLTEGGTFYTSARYPAELVYPFEGATVESVDVYINDLPSNAILKIWGPGTTTTPGELIHEQTFTPTAFAWNTIILSNSVMLDGNDIWIGFSLTHNAGYYIAGIDGGPNNPNGDYISQDGIAWEHLSDNGMSANWNIRALLQLEEEGWLSLDPEAGTILAESSETLTVTYDASSLTSGSYTANIIITSNDPDSPMWVVPVTLDLLVGTTDNKAAITQVYPIPATDVLNVNAASALKVIRIYNALGHVVREISMNGEFDKTIELDGLHSGFYSLEVIRMDGRTEQKSFIIMK